LIKSKFTWLLLLLVLGVPGLGACTESPSSTSSEESTAPIEAVSEGIQFRAVDDQVYTIEPGEEIEVDGVLYAVEDGEVKATRIQQQVQVPEVSNSGLEQLAIQNANFVFKVEGGQLVPTKTPNEFQSFHVWSKITPHHGGSGFTSFSPIHQDDEILVYAGTWKTASGGWGFNDQLYNLVVQGQTVEVYHIHGMDMEGRIILKNGAGEFREKVEQIFAQAPDYLDGAIIVIKK
jgi:hypothetical protein